MKKLFIAFLIFLTGCQVVNIQRREVQKYLDAFKTEEIVVELEKKLDDISLTESQKEKYKEILLKNYQSMTYEIIEESKEEEIYTAKVTITVYNLRKAIEEVAEYEKEHQNVFKSTEEFIDYKLEQMAQMKERVTQIVEFKVTLMDGNWVLEQPSKDILEKISGL